MPRIYNPQPDHLTQQLREIFNPKRSPIDESPTKGIDSCMASSVAVQIQQLTAPLISAGFRVIPVQVGDQTKYLVTDVNGQNCVVTLHPGVGICNCGSKYFCHHILACRIKAGVQSDLKIPSNAKLPKPSDMDKRFKGRREVHGTKKPIAADAVHAGIDNKRKRGGTAAKPTKKLKQQEKTEEPEVAEEEDEDYNYPEPQSALFLSLPDQPFAKKSLPPPVEDTSNDLLSGPICVSPPPLTVEKCASPSAHVTPGVIEVVELSMEDSLDKPPLEISYFDFTGAIAALGEVSAYGPSFPQKIKYQDGPNKEEGKNSLEATAVITGLPSAIWTVNSPKETPGRPLMSSTAFTLCSEAEDDLDNLRLSLSSSSSEDEDKINKIQDTTRSSSRKRAVGLSPEGILEMLEGLESEEVKKKKMKMLALEISDELKEKQLRMGPQEIREFRFGSVTFTFQTKEPGMVIIHTREEDEVTASVRRAAATAGANQALPTGPNSSKPYLVKVFIHEEGMPENDLTDPEEFEVSCVCGKAMSRRDLGPSIINCIICQRMFHKEHVHNTQKSGGFKCPSCSQTIHGLKWGVGKYSNTCPIDGFMTATALDLEQKPQLFKKLSSFGDVAEQKLADAIEQTQRNCSGGAHGIWGDYITTFGPRKQPFNSPTDLTGDVFARTAEALGPSVKFAIRTFCPNGNLCSSKRDSLKTIREMYLPYDSPTVSDGLRFILGDIVKQCDTCRDTEGLPLVGRKKIGVPSLEKPPIFFFLSTIQLKFTPEDYMQGPQEIVIDNIKYRLQSIHLYNDQKKHFRALIQVGEADKSSWLLYDGMATKARNKSQFRPALPTDYANYRSTENYVPSHVVFMQV